MAVYTPVPQEEIARFIEAEYALGELALALGIAEGVENTNYLVVTAHAGQETRHILTLYEKRTKRKELPFFMALMEHLAAAGVPCPLPVHRVNGEVIAELKGKPAAIVSFLSGKSRVTTRTAHIASLGAMVARMHTAVKGFTPVRANALSVEGWRAIYDTIAARMDAIRPGLAAWVGEELAYLEARWPRDLPRGIVHADIFPDNVFYEGDDVSGVIDFYFACEDMFAYDLAIVMNAWCFEGKEFNLAKAQHLFAQYRKGRCLSEAETAALPLLSRGAAMRFLLTRAYDWLHQEPGALVTPKDPMEYVAKLAFHQQVKHAAEYGV